MSPEKIQQKFQRQKFNVNMVLEQDIERHIYDEILDLQDWYDLEKKKLDGIKDFKEWKEKSNELFKVFLDKKQELITKNKDPFALKGNPDSKFLYHYTSLDSLIGIIEDNEMFEGSAFGISFSTNPNLYSRGFIFWYPSEFDPGRHHENVPIKIKLDFDKIKTAGYKFRLGSENLGTHSGEEEIRILNNAISNIADYIIEIEIYKSKAKNPELLNKAINLLKEKNIKTTFKD